jgi:mannose-6-phosphate isomerase-like protein (cupin superfamily)
MSLAHAQSVETIDVRPLGGTATEIPSHQAEGEIVVECLEGQVAITASAKTQNLHAGELLYLHAGEPHSVKGVEPASLLLSIQDPEPNRSEENETIHARGALLSVMQAAVLVIALALLFVVAAGNIFAGGLIVSAALVIFGCLHYWLWGRWMSPALPHPGRKEPH